jgi:hypothetical protein
MASRRFTRLTNGFSKKLENHAAAVSLYAAHYNLCRFHETIRSTVATPDPTETAPDRRRRFRVIEAGVPSERLLFVALLRVALKTKGKTPLNSR